MIDVIGETAGQDRFHVGNITSKDDGLNQGQITKTEDGADEPTRSRTKLEDGKIIIETYTKNGELVKITPPGYLPLDKIA